MPVLHNRQSTPSNPTIGPISRKLYNISIICLTALLALELTACGHSTQEKSKPTGKANSISFMLDWTPNTNHIGLYVAQELGYYKDAGLNVNILPTAQAGAESSVENAVADVGFSKLSDLAAINTKGADLKLVFALGQHPIARWCSLASRNDIKTPKDFDNKTFVSFGSAEQTAVVQAMIKNAGGKGDFTRITSGTNTFTTLGSGKGDFAGFYASWEGVQSDIQGPKLNCFTQSDWGVPGNPDQIGFAVKASWLKDPEHKKTLAKFIRASKQGYDWALANPTKAADILVKQTPSAHIDPQLARASMESIYKEGYWTYQPKQTNITGKLNLDDAQTYIDFLHQADTYRDNKGKPLKQAPQAQHIWDSEFVQ